MKFQSIIYLLFYALFVAMGHILQKVVLNHGVDRFILAFLRIVCGFIIITILLFLKNYKPLEVLKKNTRHFIILGVLFSGCGILLKLWGLSYTTATNASFIMSLSSLTAIFFALCILKEKAPNQFYIVSIMMIAGVYMVTTQGEQLLPQRGDIIILALTFLIGFMQVYGKKVLKTLSVLETSFGRSLFGMIFLGLLIPIFTPNGFSSIPNFPILLLVLANGITYSGSIILFYKALKKEGASNAGMFALLVPVFTVFLGRFLLSESLNFFQILGGSIILIGSYLISKIKIKQANF